MAPTSHVCLEAPHHYAPRGPHVVPAIALQVLLHTRSGLAFFSSAGTAARNLLDHTLTLEL